MKKFFLFFITTWLAFGCAFFGNMMYTQWHDKSVIDSEVKDIKNKAFKKNENKNKHELDYEVDWKTLKKECPHVVGWIYFPDLKIDYPVAQSSDNSYYLSHTVGDVYDPYGSIFMDCDCSSSLSDANTIVYGHTITEIGGMFSNLNWLNKKDLFDKCKSFYYLTPQGNYRCDLWIFANTTSDSVFYNIKQESIVHYEWSDEAGRQVAKIENKDRQYFYKEFIKCSTYHRNIDLDDNDKLLTLSTCNVTRGLYTNDRYVIVSRLQCID